VQVADLQPRVEAAVKMGPQAKEAALSLIQALETAKKELSESESTEINIPNFIKDEQGQVARLAIYTRDITGANESDDALRASERRFQTRKYCAKFTPAIIMKTTATASMAGELKAPKLAS
jgi:hypothetical protein